MDAPREPASDGGHAAQASPTPPPHPPPEFTPYVRPVLPFERKADVALGGWKWASAGIEFGLAVVLFFLGGQALDGKLGTTPWLTVTGSLLGVAAGMYLLIRSALRGMLPTSKDDRPDR